MKKIRLKKDSLTEENTGAKKTLTGSTGAKIMAFFLMTFTFVIGCVCGFATLWMAEEGVYSRDLSYLTEKMLSGQAARDYNEIVFHKGFVLNDTDWLEEYCKGTNLSVTIYNESIGTEWSNYNDTGTYYSYEYIMNAYWDNAEGRILAGYNGGKSTEYNITLYIDSEFREEDEYRTLFCFAQDLYDLRYIFPAVALGSLLLAAVCFVFLMCAAGHHNGRKGIIPSPFDVIPLEIMALIYIVPAIVGLEISVNLISYAGSSIIYGTAFAITGMAELLWGTAFCMEIMIRLKLGGWWKHTLTYIVLRWCFKLIRMTGRGLVFLITGVPLIWNALFLFAVISILEFGGLLLWGEAELAVCWFIEKAVLLFALVYFALICKKLQKGSEALADGDLAYQVDTSQMILDFKDHGENLNRIAQGMNAAVEERMMSEHLKTELITNVSHDLKTPLTSIINYADLIGAETVENERVKEYAEVLHRQSRKLKKLLEDLMEASKAATGNLEVNLQPCEIGVLLTQAAGEYEQRFQEKDLQLITRQPEEQMRVFADGRHLWRVFDNLLNNICKYAQENSRVYLSVEKKGGKVVIIFRNMSKYALDISAEELQERFVRGDKSRHMEGNGLGLSIAKSLIDLQNGRMEIVTDGDLFKVILEFDGIE